MINVYLLLDYMPLLLSLYQVFRVFMVTIDIFGVWAIS